MLAMMVTVLSLGVMAFIVVGFVVGAWRERRRHTRMAATLAQLPGYPSHLASNANVPALLPHIGNNSERNKPFAAQPSFHLSSSWYTRWRVLVSLGFLLMVVLALFVQSGVADSTLHTLGQSLTILSNDVSGVEVHTAAQTVPATANASLALVRISQLDPAQYNSTSEYNIWAYSACSAAAMTEVLNAYGNHLRITDVLKVESQIGEITPAQGLLRPAGVANTAAQFGFKTSWTNAASLDTVINSANAGHPVIVSFPPDRYPQGHIVVVIGGNSTSVYIADTSIWNRHVLSRGQFLQWWEGFAAVVTPK